MVCVNEIAGTPRPYRSALREEQAERTRHLIARAARRRFVEHGWSGTSIRAVAADAGVSEATVYAVYGTKAGLAQSLVDSADADADVARIVAELEAAEGDPRAQLTAFIGFDRRLFEHGGAGLRVLVEGRRNEPALDAAYAAGRARGDGNRRRVFESWPRPAWREGIDVDRALDVYASVCSIQVFDVMTAERGWSPDAVEEWWQDSLAELLLA